MKIQDYEWETIPRTDIIGGSDIAGIIGQSKWNTPDSVLKHKLMGTSIKVNEAMFWGTTLEASVANVYKERFLDEEKETLYDPVAEGSGAQVRHPDHPWLAASPDRLIIDPDTQEILGGLEIKCIGLFSKKSWKNNVPIYYQTQAQVYMMVFGLTSWEFFVLVGGQDSFHVCLEENPFMQETIIEEGQKFYKELLRIRNENEDKDFEEALNKYRDLLERVTDENEKSTKESEGQAYPMGRIPQNNDR
jgi:putative phage-type endonuclease